MKMIAIPNFKARPAVVRTPEEQKAWDEQTIVLKRAQKELDEKNKRYEQRMADLRTTDAYQHDKKSYEYVNNKSRIAGSYNQWIKLSARSCTMKYEKIIEGKSITVNWSNQLDATSGQNTTYYMFSTICMSELGSAHLINESFIPLSNTEEAIFTIVYLWVHTPNMSGVVILNSVYVIVDNPARNRQILVVDERRPKDKITYELNAESGLIESRDCTLRELQTIRQMIRAIDHRSDSERQKQHEEEMSEIECL